MPRQMFVLEQEDVKLVNEWLTTVVYPIEIERQKKVPEYAAMAICRDSWEHGYPYGGAIGGGLTYQFTPTSIGLITKVIYGEGEHRHELDLTDYDSW